MKSTAKATEKRSRTVVVLAIAVALMLLGSIFAQMFILQGQGLPHFL